MIRLLQPTPSRSPALAGVTAVTVVPRGIVSRTPWVVPCSIELDSCSVFDDVVVGLFRWTAGGGGGGGNGTAVTAC